MTDMNKETISVLNELIQTSKDGQAGFKTCAEDIKNPELKALFTTRANDCGTAASELMHQVTALGGKPEDSTSVSGDLHRGWINVKSMITGKSEEAILNEAEKGQDVAKKHYKEALEKNLPDNIRTLVENQYQAVLRAHDQVKALRNIARAS